MANRYWVLGTGTWSSTNTANWSASSGGGGGASVPTAADNVFFNANSNVGTGAFTVTMANTPRVCNDFTASGLDGAMTLAGTGIGLTVSGSLTFQATNFSATYTGATTFNATTTGKTVTTNGVSFPDAVSFNGVGGGWTLGSAITIAGANALTVLNGTLSTSASNYAVTGYNFNSSSSNVRTINLNASTLTFSSISTPWSMFTSTNATLNAGTSTINCSGTGGTFNGGGLIYYNVAFTSTALTTATITGSNTVNNLSIGGPGPLTITGSNTFSNITNTVQPASVLFTAGTTNTFINFSLSGTAGNLVTIGSVTAASHTLSKASGTVSSDYLSISRSTATGGAGWYAGANSTDGGNNSGWTFAAAPSASSGYPYGSGHYGIGPYNIGNLIIPGNQATGAVGTVLADRSIQEDGTIATGNVGTVTLTISIAITGNAATGAVGTLAPGSSKAVTGNAATLAVGTVALARSIDLSGNAATGAVDSVGITRSTATTGNAATGAVGTMSAEVISSQDITGVSVTGAVGTMSASTVVEVAIIGNQAVGSVGVMVGFGWGSIPDTSETWTAQSDTPETWSPVSDTAETWTPESDTSETWTQIADNSETWTQVPA